MLHRLELASAPSHTAMITAKLARDVSDTLPEEPDSQALAGFCLSSAEARAGLARAARVPGEELQQTNTTE